MHPLEFEITTFSNHRNIKGFDEKIISSKMHDTFHTPSFFWCIYYFFEPKAKSLINENYSFWIVNFVMTEEDIPVIVSQLSFF